MRVAILGAGGTIAPAIVRDLAESEEVGSLLLLDLDADRAGAVAESHGAGKAQALAADATDGLARVLGGVDVLVNSAAYRVNLAAMRACLDAGCHYLDLGGLYHVTGEQLELSPEFEAAGLLAVLGIGSAPGKTNLMGALALAELGGEAERMDIYAAGRDLEPPQRVPSFPYALRTLVDELADSPIVITGGEPLALQPMAPGPTIDFGDPIGEGETIHTLHSEIRTFAESFGCTEATFRLSLSPAVLAAVGELVGASEERIADAAHSASPPSPSTVSVHLVDARAPDGRSIRIRSLTPPHARWSLGGGIVSTASPIAAAVRLLARGAITARGALPPERCIDPAEMFAELETRGVKITTMTGVPA